MNIYKTYWFWVTVIVLAGVLIFFVRFDLPESRASFVINFENGATRKFEGPIEPGMTIIRAVYASSLNGRRFDVKYHVGSEGDVALSSIDNLINVGNREWRFYVNGQWIMTKDLDRIKVKSEDLIEAKYE